MRFLLKLKLLVFLLFSFNFTYTQNLITNPSFENFPHSILPLGIYPPNSDYLRIGYTPSPWTQRNTCDFYVDGVSSGGKANTGIACVGFAAEANNTYREYVIQAITLTGGTKYKIEFWVKRDGGNASIQMSGDINTTNHSGCSVPLSTACTMLINSNPTVSTIIAGNNNQYTKVLGFYIAPSSGTYYLTIGNFFPTSVGGSNYFFLDDVSVTPCTGLGATNPQVTLNKNAFCPNQPIIADGSNSTNVDCYKWELVNTTSSITKSTGFLTGTPSANFSVIGTFGSLTKGNCYRLKLITIEDCDQEEAYQDFCIEDPNVQLSLTGTNPYCEGDNVTITATGDNGWTYVWSNGQSGVGLKNINITTNTNTSQYTVTVTTSAGCTATQSVNLTVHSSNNVAPTTGGINNTGDFTYYINAPKFPTNNSFSFYIPTYDSPNEEVSITSWSSLPPNSTFVPNGATQEVGLYDWLNPGPNIPDIGVHTFTINVADNNACNPITVPFTFKINVACENCPLDVYYQDRHPNNKPLPAVTEAGRKIVAGYNVDANQPLGNVETGNASVLFEAPQIIEMVPGFTAGPNYTAQINPTACTDECDICCNSFTGFTHDPIPNVFTPNGDLINDVWYVSDFAHPNCAFNAKHFKLEIFSPFLAGGVKVWQKSDANLFDRCCFLSSPSSSCFPNCPNPYPHSDIYWDGKSNQNGIPLFPIGAPLPQGTYFYVLNMSGCGNSKSETGFITLCYNCNLKTDSSNINLNSSELIMRDDEDLSGLISTTSITNKTIKNELMLYPNPTKERLHIKLVNDNIIKGNVEIYSVQGKLLHLQAVNTTEPFIDVTNLLSGTYFIKLTTNHKTYQQIFIKE